MPTYDYLCPGCGDFDVVRPMSQRNDPAACPGCGASAPRVLATAPRLALVDGHTRAAIGANERSQHAPLHSRDYVRAKHPAGCGCCATGKRSSTVTTPAGNKAFPGKRPWMISH